MPALNIIPPTGRVISDFSTIRELLEALRDAIRAHQSLYIKGGILHRDISSNNIIITSPEKADGFKGMLIDLDLAKERDSGPSGARHQTGTMQFMAIEVLRGVDHTYRHDLKSFFYVLLWMCARCAWDEVKGFRKEGETVPEESILRKWEVNSLEDIMDEFPESLVTVKPLCLRVRSILFGDTARINVHRQSFVAVSRLMRWRNTAFTESALLLGLCRYATKGSVRNGCFLA